MRGKQKPRARGRHTARLCSAEALARGCPLLWCLVCSQGTLLEGPRPPRHCLRTGTGVLGADHTQQAVPMFTECAPYTRMHTHVELKHAPICSLPALLGHLTAPRQAGRRAWGHRE